MHNDEFILVRAQSANSPSCKRAEVHTKLTHGHTHGKSLLNYSNRGARTDAGILQRLQELYLCSFPPRSLSG